MSRSLRFLPILLSALILTFGLATALLAQETGERPLEETPAAEEQPEPLEVPIPELPGETPVRPDKDRLPGDWKVYVPFKDMKKVFEKEGQGVFVPFEEFLKLWESNLDRRPVPADPPVPHLITRASYEGAVEGDLATIRGRIEFETFTRGWSAVPLPLTGVALGEATLDGKPATIEAVKGGFRVLVPKRGAYTLEVSFVVPVKKTEDARAIGFQMPPVPVSRLVFDIPEEGARVTVEPNLATTRTDAGSGKTRVMAFVGAADKIQLTWRPRPAEVKEGPALVFAEMTAQALVEEASLRLRATVSYRIHRAPVDTFRLEVPTDAKVLFVEGENLQSWDVTDGALVVTLYKPVEKAYRLAVTLEKDRPERGTVSVPAVRTTGLAREQGFVLVSAPRDVKVLPKAQGLFRIDFAAVPKESRRGDMIFAWRYPVQPWSLDLDVARIEPVVDVAGRCTVRLDERRLNMTDLFTYSVTKAGIFQVRIGLPADLEITDLSRDVVDDWRIEGEGDARILILDLKGRRLGAFNITVASTRSVGLGEDPLDLALPLLRPLGARRLEGLVGVIRDESLKLETGDVAGLVPMGAAEFGGGASLAYRYRVEERAAKLTISRRDPEVTAQVATELRPEENRIAVKSRITFTIRYAGVEEFAITLPAGIEEQVEVTGNDIREKPTEALEEEGRFLQKIVLQGKVTGNYVLTVEYDLPLEALSSGERQTVEIPELVVQDVEREQGVYAIYSEPTLRISDATRENLEGMDARELPAGVERKDVFLAFKYLAHPHALSLALDKHEYLPVLLAVVHHMHLVTLLNDEGVARTEVVIEMTRNGLDFLMLGLEEADTPDTVEIATWTGGGRNRKLTKRKVVPQAGDDGAILIRMPPEAGPQDRFFVRIVYRVDREVPGMIFHDFAYRAPLIHGGKIPVVNTTWAIYPPRDVKITETGGSLPLLDRDDSWWGSIVQAFPEVFPRRAEARERRAGPPSVVPLASLAPRDQTPLRFGGRATAPDIEIVYAAPGAFVFVKVLVLLGILAWGLLGLRGASRTKRVGFTTVCVAVPLLFIPLSSTGMAEVLTSVLVGGLLVGIFWCTRAVGPGLTAWSRSRRETPAGPAPAPAKEEE